VVGSVFGPIAAWDMKLFHLNRPVLESLGDVLLSGKPLSVNEFLNLFPGQPLWAGRFSYFLGIEGSKPIRRT
jgi:hypothetical protein